MSRFATYVLAAAGLALTLPLGAQPMQKPGAPNPALVKAATYKVDRGHTLVKWSVDHMGLTPYYGLFGDVSGSLTIDPAKLSAAKVDVTIPVAKITTVNAALSPICCDLRGLAARLISSARRQPTRGSFQP